MDLFWNSLHFNNGFDFQMMESSEIERYIADIEKEKEEEAEKKKQKK